MADSIVLVYCSHCDAVQAANIVQNSHPPNTAAPQQPAERFHLCCSTCFATDVQEITEDALAGVRQELNEPRVRSGNRHSNSANNNPYGGNVARNRLSNYFLNFRRWAQERRAQQQAGRDQSHGHPIAPFVQWLSRWGGSDSGSNSDTDYAQDESDDESDDGRYGPRGALPRECREFTTEEILSTQMVLRHGVYDAAAMEDIMAHGEDCVPRLNEEAARREEAEEEDRRKAKEAQQQQQQHGTAPAASAAPPKAEEEEGEPVLPCCICLGEMLGDKTDAAVVLHCRHFYHYTCLFEWVDLNNFTCPMCRAKLIKS